MSHEAPASTLGPPWGRVLGSSVALAMPRSREDVRVDSTDGPAKLRRPAMAPSVGAGYIGPAVNGGAGDMGVLVNGEWRVDGKFPSDPGTGHFIRPDTSFRSWITPDGAPGPTGKGGFAAEPGRYHLYVSLACPWAHRTLIFRKLKGLEEAINLSVVNWFMTDDGWTFAPGRGVIPDPLHDAKFLREIYVASKPDYTGR